MADGEKEWCGTKEERRREADRGQRSMKNDDIEEERRRGGEERGEEGQSVIDSGDDREDFDLSIANRLRHRLMSSCFEKHDGFMVLCERGEQKYNRLIQSGKSEEEAYDLVLVEIVQLLSQGDQREEVQGEEQDQDDGRDVDAAREIAIQTNEEEVKKREKEQYCKCISGNILEMEVMKDCGLENSRLLEELGKTRFFRLCCARKVECCKEHHQERFNDSGPVFKFKKAVRHFLELERRCMKWYPHHWKPYFDDVAEQVSNIFAAWEGEPSQSDEELLESYLSDGTMETAVEMIESSFKESNDSISALPEQGGAIPVILIDAVRRHGIPDAAASSIRSNGVEVIVLD
eukprot:746495-Hanusia_phi.AAC.3